MITHNGESELNNGYTDCALTQLHIVALIAGMYATLDNGNETQENWCTLVHSNESTTECIRVLATGLEPNMVSMKRLAE